MKYLWPLIASPILWVFVAAGAFVVSIDLWVKIPEKIASRIKRVASIVAKVAVAILLLVATYATGIAVCSDLNWGGW